MEKNTDSPMRDPIIDELIKRELLFQQPELGASRFEIENMLDEKFWEIGSSGKRLSREHGIDALVSRSIKPVKDLWENKDFCYLEIAPKTYLLTYTLSQGKRITRRTTIWRLTDAGWKALFHQGTIVQDSEYR